LLAAYFPKLAAYFPGLPGEQARRLNETSAKVAENRDVETSKGAGACVFRSIHSTNLQSKEKIMNWDQVAGQWKQFKGKVKQKWGKLTDNDLDTIAGKRDEIAGKLQERYGYAKDQAEKEIDEFARSLNP
jgi:uncharacterized protein YjbJ (UPF0337 family)